MKTFLKVVGLGMLFTLVSAALFAGGVREKAPKYPTEPIDFIAPAGPGGGWDLTIRTVAQVLTDTRLVPVPLPVTNRPGGGGGVNLAHMQTRRGANNLISVYSPPLLLINLTGATPFSYKNLTPIANLITDLGVFAVARNSKFTSLAQVMEELRRDASSVVVGGTSAVGSMDHLQILIMARAAGVKDLKNIRYVSFQDGSGPAQLLGGHIQLLSTGMSDVRGLLQSGDLRGLAQTGSERVAMEVLKDIPTCIEVGINEIFLNWRGLFGPPDMPEYAVNYWRRVISEMVKTPEWEAARKRHGWMDNYMDAPEFMAFLDRTNEAYKTVLREIGMLRQ